jgi:hypothetical protein
LTAFCEVRHLSKNARSSQVIGFPETVRRVAKL